MEIPVSDYSLNLVIIVFIDDISYWYQSTKESLEAANFIYLKLVSVHL